MSVDVVIFDCDGVPLDSEPLAMRTLLETIAEGCTGGGGDSHSDLSPGRDRRVATGSVMKQIVAVWQSAIEDPLRGAAEWLKMLTRKAHNHPEKAYMRRRSDGQSDARESSRRGKGPILGNSQSIGFLCLK